MSGSDAVSRSGCPRRDSGRGHVSCERNGQFTMKERVVVVGAIKLRQDRDPKPFSQGHDPCQIISMTPTSPALRTHARSLSLMCCFVTPSVGREEHLADFSAS